MVIALLGCDNDQAAKDAEIERLRAELAQERQTAPTREAQPTPAPSPFPAPEPTPAEQILSANTFADAIALARPLMGEGQDEHSAGSLLMAVWAAERMKWSDVSVKKNETSVGQVMKDPEAEYGKRMCGQGRIIEIRKMPDVDLFQGLLMGGNVVHFFAAGSTGTLVAGKNANYCAVITGLFHYSNSGGGTTHAVDTVGMFDVKANTQPTRAAGSTARSP
jgi:hypothetical protein